MLCKRPWLKGSLSGSVNCQLKSLLSNRLKSLLSNRLKSSAKSCLDNRPKGRVNSQLNC